jgi:hypothetical protein
VTLLEGQAVLLRSTGRFALAEGVRVHTGDVLHVEDKGLLQLGFADGTKLSIGPQARLHVAELAAPGPGARSAPLRDFYLLQGWSKLALAPPAARLRLTTPLLGLLSGDAIVVLQVEGAQGSLFVEKGEVRLAEGFVKATPASPVTLRAGQFYSRRAKQKGTPQPRPAAAFVAAMPRPYQDNLPERRAKYPERDVVPRRLGELAYADVEPWLKGPPELRRPMMQRLRSRANEPEFRKALIANMRFHPEWDRVLFPDKYKPKPPSTADPVPRAEAR